MKPIKAVIFDCFGVLVGTGFWSIYERAGGNIDRDKAFTDEWLKLRSLEKVSGEAMTQAMADRLGISVKKWREIIDRDEVPTLPLFDFIKSKLYGKYKLGVLSNAGRGMLARKLTPEQLSLFDDSIISAEVGLVKPDPAIFRLAAQRLELDPSEIIFVDDHREYLNGASSIGMKTLLFKGFDQFVQEFDTMIKGTTDENTGN